MSTLPRTKTLVLEKGEDRKEFVVTFPNSGEEMNIDLMKIQISDGKFDTLKYSFNPSFVKQATRCEAIATFVILIPKIKEALNVKSLLDLQHEDMQLIEDMYTEQFLPWYEEWMAVLSKPKEEKKKDEK